jgi:quercetin dioxygenase-like cupin family protein
MGYKPSPRPTFTHPTLIPYDQVTRHLWGDEEAGEVADWIYVSSDKIHQLVFGLPPHGAFRHSDSFRTIFAADEVLYVLSGTMMISNPECGEVHRVTPGQAVFFRRDTWHHAFNYSDEPLRVLEFFAPPPSQGTSGAYARQQAYLDQVKYVPEQWLGRWPMEMETRRRESTMKVIHEGDGFLWSLEGEEQQVLTGILASTEHLTVGKTHLFPGRKSGTQIHDGDESIYVLEGTLHLLLPESEGPRWFELHERDGFYLPGGTPHKYYNISGRPVEFLFGIAPGHS